MKICIIGAGWFGCHIAYKLIKEGHDIKIFEKEKKIFLNASGNNQNRLHRGFHYPRCEKTIKISKEGFIQFKKEYGFLTKKIKNNIYSIAKSNVSKLNFNTYCSVLKKSKLKYKKLGNKDDMINNFSNLEGSIRCNEELIMLSKSINFFEKKLNNKIIFNYKVKQIVKKQKKFFINNEFFDYIIDCTGFRLKTNNIKKLKYEYCAIFLYKKKDNKKKFSLTIMDGPFFTLYPWSNKNDYGLYSVKYSRLIKDSNIRNLEKKVSNKININYLKKIQTTIEKDFEKFYPNFKKEFKFKDYLLSYRTLTENKLDTRICHIYNNNKVITVFPGKIDHIFYAYKEVKKCLKKS
jgi:hypothetical protein